MSRLKWLYTCDKYQNLMNWLNYIFMIVQKSILIHVYLYYIFVQMLVFHNLMDFHV